MLHPGVCEQNDGVNLSIRPHTKTKAFSALLDAYQLQSKSRFHSVGENGVDGFTFI